MKITKGKTYIAWLYKIYYMASDFPNAKTEKLREPTFHRIHDIEFETKEGAEKFAEEHTIEEVLSSDENLKREYNKVKRLKNNGIKVEWEISKTEITPLYF